MSGRFEVRPYGPSVTTAGYFRYFGTAKPASRCKSMRRFFFDLAGDLSAHDFMGHDCASKMEAKRHASFIANRIGTERPSFARPGNYISVRDDRGTEIFKAPIKCSLSACGSLAKPL
jgi:hypothetical protein